MTEERGFTQSIDIERSPEQVYDLVSDVTRTGEWSPVCTACWWDDGDGPRAGAYFTGHNEVPGRVWETRSQVVAARRGVEFSWMVGEGYVLWGFHLEPIDGGTRLTQSWTFRLEGLAMFHTRYGDDAEAQIENRTQAAHSGIPVSLAAIKRIAEAAPR